MAVVTRNGSLENRIADVCAAGAMLFGVLAVLGWVFALPVLTRVSPPYRAIAPSAAATLIALGAILLWSALGRGGRTARVLLGTLAGLIAVYGLLDLVGFLVGADLNREDALTAYLARAWSIPFMPMSPIAGALIALVGAAAVALLLRPCEDTDGSPPGNLAGALGALAAGGALVFVLSYVHGAPLLYGSSALPIAATSAVGFLLLGVGVMAAAGPACWPLRSLGGDSVRARMLRTVVPLTVLAVLLSMVASEQVPALAGANRALQSSLLAVVFAVVAGVVASRVAAVVGRALDASRSAQREAQEALRESERRWATTLASIGDAVIATDVAGRISFMNPTAVSATGWTLQEAVTRPVTDVFHIVNEETSQKVECPVPRVLREGVVVGLANHTLLVRRDGTEVPIDDSGAPIVDEAGQLTGVVLVFHDISARRQAERAVRESEVRYRSLFENMLDGFAYCRMLYEDGVARDFVYLDVNSAFEKLTGLKDVVGRNVSEVIPGIRETNPELFEIYGRVARSGRPERFEVYLEALDMWLSISVYSPAEGHFVAVFDNITARRQAEEALRESQRDLNRAQAVAHTGSWRLDVRRNQLSWSEEVYRVFGLPSGTSLTYEAFLDRVHPEDREYVDQRWAAALQGEPYDIEHRILVGDAVKWVRERAELEFDSDGTLLGGFGTVQDITEGKREEQERDRLHRDLLAAEQARAALAEHVSDEIAHRVKNNLAMVSGLLHMQMLSAPDPEAAEAMRDAIGRIRTFVTLHEQMYASRAEEADLLVALQRIGTTIAELFAEKGNVGISVRGETIWCSARVATNLSVIASELITNALKHGGPGTDGRHMVAVRLQRAGEDLALTVSNSGAPVLEDLDPATSRTMGLRLVHDIVVGQYRGRFSVRPSEGGTLAEVVVPGEAIRADSLPR
jgi:PAS domain S-box-containing protein